MGYLTREIDFPQKFEQKLSVDRLHLVQISM
jgi:hypothetical protein